MEHKITGLDKIKAFATAGNAIFTVSNPNTGRRFTYRVRQGKGENAPLFVSVLTGSQNETDYSFLGVIFGDGAYKHGRKSQIMENAPSARAFDWIWARLSRGLDLGPAEVHHCGRCGRCGRLLTTPESIESGIGPVCADLD